MGTGSTRTFLRLHLLSFGFHQRRHKRAHDKLSPSKVGTGSSVFRPALAGGAAHESTKTNQIKRRRQTAWYHPGQRHPDGSGERGGTRAPLTGLRGSGPRRPAEAWGRRPPSRCGPFAEIPKAGWWRNPHPASFEAASIAWRPGGEGRGSLLEGPRDL